MGAWVGVRCRRWGADMALPFKRETPKEAAGERTGRPTNDDNRWDGRITLAQALARCAKAGIRAMTAGALTAMGIPPRLTLLALGTTPILRAGQLGQVFATRGIGKTWFTLTVALIMAAGGAAMGYHAPVASRVVYVDGEMALEDLQERVRVLVGALGLDAEAVANNLVLIAADWQEEPLPMLDTSDGQQRVEPLVEWADVVFLDNRSCLFNAEGEKDPTAWEPAAAWIASLRRRKKACVMVHHANRQGGARGHSKAEDPLDIIMKLDNPDDYQPSQGARFTVTFEKTRGIPGGSALLPRTMQLTANGWVVEGAEAKATAANAIEERILERVDGGKFRTKNAALEGVRGKSTTKGKVWDDLVTSGHLKHDGECWVVVRNVTQATA
jgi:hypothetical protein